MPPMQPCFVIVEDPRVAELLFVGTELGCHASFDRGTTWQRLGKNLPTVQVRDLVIQDRESDLIAATHGHGAMVIDISALRQIRGDIVDDGVHLFTPERVTRWQMRSRGTQGDREWFAPNPPSGATVYLFTATAPAPNTRVVIADLLGESVATLEVPAEAGFHVLSWELRAAGRRRGRSIEAGTYAARFTLGDVTSAVPILVRDDPDGATHPFANPLSTPTSRQ